MLDSKGNKAGGYLAIVMGNPQRVSWKAKEAVHRLDVGGLDPLRKRTLHPLDGDRLKI